MKKLIQSSLLAGLLLNAVGQAQELIREAQKADHTATVEEAIATVSRPAHGFGGMPGFGALQTYYRLSELRNYERRFYYKYAEKDRAAWKSLLENTSGSIYARMCAAYMLLGEDEAARRFLEQQVKSENLRHQYNAVKVVEMYVGRDPSKAWAIDLLLQLISSGSLDGSGVKGSRMGGPEGDLADIMCSPLDDICWDFGFMKLQRSVPVLMNVLERLPDTTGAAFALGEIGDPSAIPVLLKVFKENQPGLQRREIEALGKLKAQDAVPLLVERLAQAPKDDTLTAEAILTALLEIRAERAIPSVENYLKSGQDRRSVAVAKRVLIQLKSSDPSSELLDLLDNETYEPEKSDIIAALTKHGNDRVVAEFERLARTSDSAFIRREAIDGLTQIRSRSSLLALAGLLDVKFSADLKAEWGWKGPPDFSIYFPEKLIACLKSATGQSFDSNRKVWEDWIRENINK